jgi:hypothetical protein
MGLCVVLEVEDLTVIKWWVDGSYATHPDMRSHTGGAMSFGRGGFFCKSQKQKLNTKSSTEAETVGASDYLPNTIWVKNFLDAQGYHLVENVLEQDNESAIKLETNGRLSAGPRSRHIDIRYFWMKDRIATEGITIRHCPTLQMTADFFTKPLQGALFQKFRDVLMGHKPMNTLAIATPMPLEERVRETKRSDYSVVKRASIHNYNDTTATVNTGQKTNVTWADIVRRSAGSTEAKPRTPERVAGMRTKSRVFRDIILSKQSSDKQ